MCAHSRANLRAYRGGFRGRHCCTQVHALVCTFLEPSKMMDFLVPLSKRCTREQTIVKKFASIKVRKRWFRCKKLHAKYVPIVIYVVFT
jgi:hypothetical protein